MCLTVRDARRVSEWLAENGIEAPAYYGSLEQEGRQRLEAALRDNEVKALVATIALGMGFDKPDLAFVVHFQRPPSVITYYQQIGRAGRGVERAEVILLSGAEEDEIAEYFIDGAFPPADLMREVLAVVRELEHGARIADLEARVNATRSMIGQALRILEVEGAVVQDGGRWQRTANPWTADLARMSAVSETRRSELARMKAYTETSGCLMRFLTAELDDADGVDCGRCANCGGSIAPAEVDPEAILAATRFLKRAHRPIAPRKRWPVGLEAPYRGDIPEDQRLREGMALCVYGDSGWGRLVKEGKFGDGAFADDLVEAVAAMIAEQMELDPYPTWITGVPSRRNPHLVSDFAERLANRLGLAYRCALVKQRETPPQKTMENGLQQARNTLGAFAAIPDEVVVGEPALLVDDMVDSRWSMTACGIASAEAGAGPVYPIALAETSVGARP